MSATQTNQPNVVSQGADGVRVLFGVGGLIALALGIFMLFAPQQSGQTAVLLTAVLLGVYALVTGLVYAGSAIFSKTLGGWARAGHILLGLLYIVGGVIIMSNLTAAGVLTAVFFVIVLGVLWLFEGIFAFVTAAKSDNKVWSIIYGIISVIAGITLIVSPLMGAITLWWLLGIAMAVLGVVQIVRAFSLGK